MNGYTMQQLNSNHLDKMMMLQDVCLKNNDPFISSKRETYGKSFINNNFCLGYTSEKIGIDNYNNDLFAFCNCTIPSGDSSINLGRGILDDCDLDRVGHINTILVHPQLRNKRFAKQMIERALFEFTERDVEYIFVTIDPQNLPSLNLFTSFGFNFRDIIVKNVNNEDYKRYILCKRMQNRRFYN